MRSFFTIIASSVALGIALLVTAMLSASSVLMEKATPAKADVIVVLGGDVAPRAERAALLWREGLAPTVLASGAGDCRSIRRLLVDGGVERASVIMECLSRTTWENAQFAQPILNRLQVRSAILVTSWYHSERAISRFRSVMPDVKWISVPAETPPSYENLFFDVEGVQVLQEYVKLFYYNMRADLQLDDEPAPSRTPPKAIIVRFVDPRRSAPDTEPFNIEGRHAIAI
jgi:uncharacterized SAM-binding protein YcdF (DUF218 family)